jgi:hypothetical protein
MSLAMTLGLSTGLLLPIASVSATTTVPPTLATLSATAGKAQTTLRVMRGGDMDVKLATVGGRKAWTTGNGSQIVGPVPDHYLGLNAMYVPTVRFRAVVTVSYLDAGTDSFSLTYDGSTGAWSDAGVVHKTGTGTWASAAFMVCSGKFGNRENGGDLRLSDNGDGADSFSTLTVRYVPDKGATTFRVDDFGANPYDTNPDSTAIQKVLDTAACSGDTVRFTGGTQGVGGYQGYSVDKTIFLIGRGQRRNLTFGSANASNAVLTATAGLRGFVIRAYARSRTTQPGLIDNITLDRLTVDGNRDNRVCLGANGIGDGIDDSWGSWMASEQATSSPGDPWLAPGNIAMDGGIDPYDPAQNYTAHPASWSTGFRMTNLVSRNAECGTAFAASGAKITIINASVLDAGDHVHAAGCTHIDADGDNGAWSDGLTLTGPDMTVAGSTIVNPSDVGIAFFGGQRVHFSNIRISLTGGNHGAFAAIGLHGQWFGDYSGGEVTGITVTSTADTSCGGFHAGLDIGPQMWGGGCFPASYSQIAVGDGSCVHDWTIADPAGHICGNASVCQEWIWASATAPFVVHDNNVSGAMVDYVVGGVSGAFSQYHNAAGTPRQSDWEAASAGCLGHTWGPMQYAAHNPTIPGWTDLSIQCER